MKRGKSCNYDLWISDLKKSNMEGLFKIFSEHCDVEKDRRLFDLLFGGHSIQECMKALGLHDTAVRNKILRYHSIENMIREIGGQAILYEMPIRALTSFGHNRISFEKLCKMTTYDIVSIRGIGKKTALRVLDVLRKSGIEISGSVDDGKPKRCSFPEGMTIKPDGIHELDPCLYKTTEIHRNVTVEVRRCVRCGHVDLVWHRQEDTESEMVVKENG